MAAAAQEARQSKSNARRTLMEHPMVLQALEILGGELQELKPLKPDGVKQTKSGTGSVTPAPLE